MDAVAALTEIAFWLERGRAATFKVQAFRKAAAAISALAGGEAQEGQAQRGLARAALADHAHGLAGADDDRGCDPAP